MVSHRLGGCPDKCLPPAPTLHRSTPRGKHPATAALVGSVFFSRVADPFAIRGGACGVHMWVLWGVNALISRGAINRGSAGVESGEGHEHAFGVSRPGPRGDEAHTSARREGEARHRETLAHSRSQQRCDGTTVQSMLAIYRLKNHLL